MIVLLGTAVELIFIVGVIVLIYQIFLSDRIKAKKLAKQQLTEKVSGIDRVARIKLISDDSKDIEEFITTNAQYLSDDMVKQLVNRLEVIKCDNIIYEDSLKKRVSTSPSEEELEEEIKVSTRKTRK